MMKLLILLFCKFFQFSKYIGNAPDDDPYAYKAMCILTLFLSLNIFTLYAYYKCLVDHSSDTFLSKGIEIVIVVLVGVALSLAFLKGKQYESIYEKFRENPKISGQAGTWITVLYMVATVILLISLIWVRCKS